jgi:hypothetical protein
MAFPHIEKDPHFSVSGLNYRNEPGNRKAALVKEWPFCFIFAEGN